MSITANWLNNRQHLTGLDYSPIADQLEQVEAARNPNDTASNQRFLRNLFAVTDRHEAGKQLPIPYGRLRR
ncbi:hypothetical protein [Hymenobacter fodinae]|uniref:Uncharacterized protein n=1 Tax=Hymenobacter fodinae TaxID=2510796 RepID=A0A4Z0P133_9BACT|nr:hypothetical protein [Hymenobacter fodinae]TGE04641.1 hypothetical protein EU556_20870 [Hymenobacter fodinae]